MTRFRLNAGRPAPTVRGRSSVSDEEFSSKPVRPWSPNIEKDTPLKCGCMIPWPIMTLLGSGGKVYCDLHGYQHVTKKEIDHAKQLAKEAKTCSGNQDQESILDQPPF